MNFVGQRVLPVSSSVAEAIYDLNIGWPTKTFSGLADRSPRRGKVLRNRMEDFILDFTAGLLCTIEKHLSLLGRFAGSEFQYMNPGGVRMSDQTETAVGQFLHARTPLWPGGGGKCK